MSQRRVVGETPALRGAHRPRLETWLPSKDVDGTIVNINVVAEEDSTERKRAEAELRRLAAIVEFSNDAIIGSTLDGGITTGNHGGEFKYGYPREEAVGKPVSLLAVSQREDEMPAILEQIKRGARLEHYETPRRRKDGAEVPVSLTVSPIRDADSTIIGASMIARDISERRRNEQALRELNETLELRVAERTAELEEVNTKLRSEIVEHEHADARLRETQSALYHAWRLNAVGHMAAALAHELNQPLTAAIGYLDTVQRRLANGRIDGTKTSLEDIGDATGQVLRAGQIIRRIRDFVTRGATERRIENVGEMIEEAHRLALAGSGAHGVDVQFLFDADASRVLVDRIQIQQVLVNLMRNAIEAMAKSERRRLDVTTRLLDRENIQIACAATRRGAGQRVALRLFEPFVSTKRDGMG